MKIERAFAKTIIEDTAANPALIFAVADARSKGQLIDLIMADIYREVKGLPGPALFPRTRALFLGQLRRARARIPVTTSAVPAGMGQWSALTAAGTATAEALKAAEAEAAAELLYRTKVEEAAKKKAEEAKATDWGKLVGDAIGGLAKAGAGIYNTRKKYEFEKDKIKSEQAAAASAYQTNANAMYAAAAFQKQQVGVGLPDWVVPVGIAAVLGVAAIFVVPKFL